MQSYNGKTFHAETKAASAMWDEGALSAAEAADSVLPWQRSQRAERGGHAQFYQDADQTDAAWKSHRPKYRRMFTLRVFAVFKSV